MKEDIEALGALAWGILFVIFALSLIWAATPSHVPLHKATFPHDKTITTYHR